MKKRQPDRTVLDKGGVCKSFNAAAHKGEPAPRSFEACLESHFGPETTQEVLDIFARLELPVPEDPVQYLDGMEGPLVFVNRYGVVARVEHPQSMHSV